MSDISMTVVAIVMTQTVTLCQIGITLCTELHYMQSFSISLLHFYNIHNPRMVYNITQFLLLTLTPDRRGVVQPKAKCGYDNEFSGEIVYQKQPVSFSQYSRKPQRETTNPPKM